MKYTVQNTLVKGDGYSYNLNNKYDAQKLCEKLNGYETRIAELENKENIQQYLVKILMDISVLKHDIDTLKEAIE